MDGWMVDEWVDGERSRVGDARIEGEGGRMMYS